MQINIVGHNVELTPALKTAINEKFKRLEERSKQITHLQVTLSVENLDHCIEATARIQGDILHAESIADDMYDAIDDSVNKLLKQITKRKEKMTERHR